jgi:hypothetical protein
MGLCKKVREMLRERESAISIDVVEGVCLIPYVCVYIYIHIYTYTYIFRICMYVFLYF